MHQANFVFQDRILMLRVEQVCFCIISGEWPKNCQSLLPSISNQGDSTGFSSSQTSTSMTEDRGTPVASSFSNILPNASDVNLLAGRLLCNQYNELASFT